MGDETPSACQLVNRCWPGRIFSQLHRCFAQENWVKLYHQTFGHINVLCHTCCQKYTPTNTKEKLTYPLKIDGWKMKFLDPYQRTFVNFRGGACSHFACVAGNSGRCAWCVSASFRGAEGQWLVMSLGAAFSSTQGRVRTRGWAQFGRRNGAS